MGGAFTFASSAGCDLLPVLLGQFISSVPMSLMYLQVAAAAVCLAAFSAAIAIAAAAVKGQKGMQAVPTKDTDVPT